jgi:uncharacterized protein involved in outer membrane biogenesis
MWLIQRRTVFVAATVLLLLGAAVLALSGLVVNRYRGDVQAKLAARLHRDVSIGSMRVSFLPPGLRVEQPVIGEDPGFPTGRPFARAEELSVRVGLLALLRGRIEPQSVELRRPAIELVRNADGAWNVTSLGDDRRSGGGLVLNRLIVTGGQVAVTNLAARDRRRLIYDGIDLTLDDYAPDRPFRLVVTAKLPGGGQPRLTVRGEGGPIARGRMAQASFTGEAEIDGVVTGTAGVTLSANEAVLERVAVTLGSSKAQGRLTVRNFASPEIDFTMSADTIDVVEMQRLFAAARIESGSGFPENARPRQVSNDSILLRTTGTGRLHAGTIRYDKLLLENAQAEVRLDRGVITLQPLTASAFGGRHLGSVVVDAGRMPTTFTVDSRFEQVDANRLVSATTNLDDVVTGTLSSSSQVTFTADGTGTIAPSLNGTLSLTIPDGSIAHTDLKHAIAALAGFNTGDDDQQVTKVRDLRAHFTVTNGVAHTDDMAATLDDDSTIDGTGSIDLVDQALNLRLTAVLSRELSDRVGGRRVASVMRTVLANRNGDVVVPMRVIGTTRRPRFAPDMERLAEMKVGDRLPNPAAKVKEALDRILGGRGTREPAQGK